MDKVKIFKDITDKMASTYKAKNSDYGDSYSEIRDRYIDKFPSVLIRLRDKINRIEQLMLNGNQKVKDESIDDSLLDLANYCVLELIERHIDKEEMEFNNAYKEVDREKVEQDVNAMIEYRQTLKNMRTQGVDNIDSYK